jgi:hypothetical protein
VRKKAVVIGLVAVAAILVLILKPSSGPTPAPDAASPTTVGVLADERVGVLLFADMREVGSRCGCGAVIDMAREAGQNASVSYSEIDIRKNAEQASKHGVRVNPTVIIVDPDGHERSRFEGESPEVLDRLSEALGALGKTRGS